jgi:hypothetical protein
MNPQLTDDAVADLPLAAARAELLEEIMSTPVVESSTTTPSPRAHRPRRWLAPVAAAAAVATLVGLPTWLLAGPEDAREARPATSAPTAHEWIVLEAPGWEVAHVSVSGGDREVSYEKGGARLDINLSDARDRASYIEDRQHIDHPEKDPGTPVTLLGEDALLWAYAADDHTVIGAAEDGDYPEVRGSGMRRAAYLVLLDQLAWTDRDGFEEALPDGFVTRDEAGSTIADMLLGIGLAPGAEVPTSDESDPYHLGADVAGKVVCGWIEEYERAVEAGDEQAAQIAQANLRETPTWEFLHDMDARGDYPEVVWEISAEVVAGQVPEGYREGLGCE